TEPTALEDVRVGDAVSFHPTTTPDETYTHRVVGAGDSGDSGVAGDSGRRRSAVSTRVIVSASSGVVRAGPWGAGPAPTAPAGPSSAPP
ncbi:hypothetical protein C5C42_10270, partial [Rathayibacter sp. AY1F7]